MKRSLCTICICAVLPFLFISQALAGSLYDPQTFRPLTADNKAFRVGDTLTVQVLENSSASTSADTASRRNNDINASAQSANGGTLAQAGITLNGQFDGGGRTQRANRLLATLSVTVQEILPNGELRISGEQFLTVNEEQQRVTLEGRTRPQDISDGNIVLSTRIADARITYIGEGDVTERSQRGSWRKLIDWLGF